MFHLLVFGRTESQVNHVYLLNRPAIIFVSFPFDWPQKAERKPKVPPPVGSDLEIHTLKFFPQVNMTDTQV